MEDPRTDREVMRDFLLEVFPNLRTHPDELVDSAVGHFEVLLEAQGKFIDRNLRYKDLWRKGGWLAHLIHVRQKVNRALQMFMDTDAHETVDEPLDDSIDGINYEVFFIRKYREGDKSGGMSL